MFRSYTDGRTTKLLSLGGNKAEKLVKSGGERQRESERGQGSLLTHFFSNAWTKYKSQNFESIAIRYFFRKMPSDALPAYY